MNTICIRYHINLTHEHNTVSINMSVYMSVLSQDVSVCWCVLLSVSVCIEPGSVCMYVSLDEELISKKHRHEQQKYQTKRSKREVIAANISTEQQIAESKTHREPESLILAQAWDKQTYRKTWPGSIQTETDSKREGQIETHRQTVTKGQTETVLSLWVRLGW